MKKQKVNKNKLGWFLVGIAITLLIFQIMVVIYDSGTKNGNCQMTCYYLSDNANTYEEYQECIKDCKRLRGFFKRLTFENLHSFEDKWEIQK